MKSQATILMFLLTSPILLSQERIEGRYITVTGSAEISVQPDQIDLDITLQEYEMPGIVSKMDLSRLEEKLMKVLEKNQVSKKDILFKNSDMYWYYWWRHRHSTEQRKTYAVRLDTSINFLQLVRDLDFNGVANIHIANSTNRRIQEFRKQVKIEAVKAAKEKAGYLLESIGEKVGRVVSIDEQQEYGQWYGRELTSNVAISSQNTGDELEGITSIKLRYEIRAKFEIE